MPAADDKRITLRVSHALHHRFKVDCATRGVTLNDALTAMLEREIGSPPARSSRPKALASAAMETAK